MHLEEVVWCYYRLHRFDYFDTPVETAFNLDGWQHALGVAQTILPPHPWTYVRIGAEALFRDTEGPEFDSLGGSAHLGAGVLLPWFDVEVSGLYRFTYLDFENKSELRCEGDGQDAARTDRCDHAADVHEISVNMNVPIWDRLSLDVSGSFVFYGEDTEFYRYDRQIVGTYLTWDFGDKPKPRRRPRPTREEPEREEGRFPGE